MREFTTPSFPVYMYDVDGNYTVKTIGEVSMSIDRGQSGNLPLYTLIYTLTI